MTQQGLRQASFRAIHGGAGLTLNGDILAACRAELEAAELDVPADINSRLAAWLRFRLSATGGTLPELMVGFANVNGADCWSALGAFDPVET